MSSLDPDAPSREGRVGKFMESDDIAREAAFLEGVWRLVRAGELAKAKQLCVIHGQPWRAAILAGGGLCHSVLQERRRLLIMGQWVCHRLARGHLHCLARLWRG